ncbi:MAG: phage terminase small subunit [Desulfitobacteriaceae bacterium]
MGGRGPAPKPTNLRQRRNKKVGSSTLDFPEDEDKTKIPSLLNPDKRKFHRLTRAWWKKVWTSPMASEYLDSDIDGLARIALLVDEYYKNPVGKGAKEMLGEIRLQEARFGLSPVDRSRLQWEVLKGEEAERKRKPLQPAQLNQSAIDPRGILGVVK